MRKYLNWRFTVLAVLAMAALVFAMGESDSVCVLLAIKAAAILCGVACWWLAKMWCDVLDLRDGADE